MAVSNILRGAESRFIWAFSDDTPIQLTTGDYTQFPSDGYLSIKATSAMTIYLSGYDYHQILDFTVPANQSLVVFVRAGMIGKIQSGSGTAAMIKLHHD